jgi:hypothetical protein
MLFSASRLEASTRMCVSSEDDPMLAWLCALAQTAARPCFPGHVHATHLPGTCYRLIIWILVTRQIVTGGYAFLRQSVHQ